MKKEAEEKGWNAIQIHHDGDVAFFKQFRKPLKLKDLSKAGKNFDIYIYDPNLDIDEYKPVDKFMKETCAKYLNLTNLMYDLVPLFSYICEDPMLESCPEEKQFLEDY